MRAKADVRDDQGPEDSSSEGVGFLYLEHARRTGELSYPQRRACGWTGGRPHGPGMRAVVWAGDRRTETGGRRCQGIELSYINETDLDLLP